MASWDDILTPRDKEVFALSGFGKKAGLGQRPALLIIDVNYNFTGDKPEPILESVKRFRTSCGEEGWDGVQAIREGADRAQARHADCDDEVRAGDCQETIPVLARFHRYRGTDH